MLPIYLKITQSLSLAEINLICLYGRNYLNFILTLYLLLLFYYPGKINECIRHIVRYNTVGTSW